MNDLKDKISAIISDEINSIANEGDTKERMLEVNNLAKLVSAANNALEDEKIKFEKEKFEYQKNKEAKEFEFKVNSEKAKNDIEEKNIDLRLRELELRLKEFEFRSDELKKSETENIRRDIIKAVEVGATIVVPLITVFATFAVVKAEASGKLVNSKLFKLL